MAKSAFKVGDIVQLKSGGPQMTIEALDMFGGTGHDQIKCQWFGGRKLEHGFFSPQSIVLSSEVEKKDGNKGS